MTPMCLNITNIYFALYDLFVLAISFMFSKFIHSIYFTYKVNWVMGFLHAYTFYNTINLYENFIKKKWFHSCGHISFICVQLCSCDQFHAWIKLHSFGIYHFDVYSRFVSSMLSNFNYLTTLISSFGCPLFFQLPFFCPLPLSTSFSFLPHW